MTHYRGLPGIEMNIGGKERIFSLMTGSALLFYALARKKSTPLAVTAAYLVLRGSTGYSPIYQSLDIDTTTPPSPVRVKSVLTVNLPREEVFAFWRKFDNLPLFMKHLESVKILDDQHSQWKARIPGGTIDWVSQITSETKNEHLAWESIPDSDVQHQGEVRFSDAGKYGTGLQLEFSYKPPAGKIGSKVAKLLNPLLEEVIKEDVKNFRRYLETGEVPTIKGQASGKNK